MFGASLGAIGLQPNRDVVMATLQVFIISEVLTAVKNLKQGIKVSELYCLKHNDRREEHHECNEESCFTRSTKS